jgi:hypothetical protein
VILGVGRQRGRQLVTNPTVMDPAIQSAGSAIADASLQAAVQGVIDKMI